MSKLIPDRYSKRTTELINDRHIRNLPISKLMMKSMFLQGSCYHYKYKGLPKDFVSMGAVFDPASDNLLIRVVSCEFSPVPEGAHIPVLDSGSVTIDKCTCGHEELLTKETL